MKKIVLPLIALCCACGHTTTPTAPETAQTLADSTISRPVQPQDSSLQADAVSGATAVATQPSFNGTMVLPPESHATVTLTMDGTVRATSLMPGAYVRRGDVLCTLENPSFIDLQQTYLDSHAQTEFLRAEYLRQQTLAREEAASQKRFQQSKADYYSMKSRMEGAAAQLMLLGVDTAALLSSGIEPLMQVKAPISGYVADMQMNMGRHFSAGDPLCAIIDKSRTMLRLTAYEKDLDKIDAGDQVQFRVNGMGKRVFHGRVASVSQQVDDTNRSVDVDVTIREQEARFRPGMYVTARIIRK